MKVASGRKAPFKVLQGLKNKLYDFIRHDARFEAIIEKLEAVAK